MLELLHHVMERAIEEQWQSIGAEQIRRVFQDHPPEEPEDDEIDTTPLAPATPDLKGDEQQ